MQDKYHNDRFEVILRKVNATSSPEWRIKCLDCPGKVNIIRSIRHISWLISFLSCIHLVQVKPSPIMKYI